ncbi:hypothetical protein [Mesorhizobium sp. L-8-10]|uniref:hypothetical protein n=1 Tax=Mesorhizobium sp. L-8-10 TaxID=2744523 RepID=UPI001927405C|nr:hypothetical protein [Mesorhizobium sp. L-8-10]
MTSSRRPALRRLVRTLPAFLIAASVSACVAQQTQATATQPVAGEVSQPRVATYECGSDGVITVENRGDSVHVVGTDGEAIDLPAAPAAQRSRYGAGADAIVIEGREALFMHGRHPPLTCTR